MHRQTDTPAPAEPEPVSVGLRDGARLLGLGENALFSAIAEGRGPRTFRVGRRHLVTIEALRDWARELEAEGQGDAAA